MKDREGNEWVLVPVNATEALMKPFHDVAFDEGSGGSPDYESAWSDLIAAAPQFVAGEVDDAMCERVFDRAYGLQSECGEDTSAHEESNAWLAAWRSELGPTLGLVEIREPSREDYIAISEKYAGIQREQVGTLVHASVSAGMMREGRDIFNAVSKWLKGEL